MKKLYILFIFQFLFIISFAQDKDLKNEAAYAYDSKDYKKSYELYDKLYTQSPKNLEYKFRLGYSSLYYPEKKARSIEIFESLKTQDKSADANYYLAKAYHINYRFDDAIVSYELYISTVGNKIRAEDKPLIEDAKHGIINCENGKELITKKVIADIKNIGAPLNTNEQEYVPVISTDESILIYTYVGKNTTGGKVNDDLKPDNEEGYFHEDIYIAKKATDTTFTEGQNISNSINTKGHDAAIALSPDGSILFTFSSTNTDHGDIYSSKLKGEDWSAPERLNSNINTTDWEGSCSITSDGRYLYFASERPGGLGGKDLYVSEKVNGDWGPAVNLGPQINTQFNEDAPFIHPDGITLFFSSQGHKSIGGYDIMYSIKQENNWIEPLSMGIPLNTTEDDLYYVINAKGDRGYFSSNRGGSGGKGGQDIYTVEPGILGERPILALLKGNVYADDKPTEAKIEIIKKSNNEAIGPYYANSKTGKYLMALSPGNGYRIMIIITVPGFDPIEEELDVEKLTKFVEIKKDFYVYTETFANKKEQKSVKSILDSLLGNITNVESFKNDVKNNVPDIKTNTVIPTPTVSVATNPCNGSAIIDFSQLKGKSLNDPTNYKKLLEIGGTTCAQGLIFKIQIAAYQFPQNYKYDHLKEFGVPEITNYPDGVTRFTQLQFATINEAEVARQKIIAKGQTDAWITGFVDGKRYTLEELISVNFFGKSIN
jgi:tetratricopeptide (TPR) repeat protein